MEMKVNSAPFFKCSPHWTWSPSKTTVPRLFRTKDSIKHYLIWGAFILLVKFKKRGISPHFSHLVCIGQSQDRKTLYLDMSYLAEIILGEIKDSIKHCF